MAVLVSSLQRQHCKQGRQHWQVFPRCCSAFSAFPQRVDYFRFIKSPVSVHFHSFLLMWQRLSCVTFLAWSSSTNMLHICHLRLEQHLGKLMVYQQQPCVQKALDVRFHRKEHVCNACAQNRKRTDLKCLLMKSGSFQSTGIIGYCEERGKSWLSKVGKQRCRKARAD